MNELTSCLQPSVALIWTELTHGTQGTIPSPRCCMGFSSIEYKLYVFGSAGEKFDSTIIDDFVVTSMSNPFVSLNSFDI